MENWYRNGFLTCIASFWKLHHRILTVTSIRLTMCGYLICRHSWFDYVVIFRVNGKIFSNEKLDYFLCYLFIYLLHLFPHVWSHNEYWHVTYRTMFCRSFPIFHDLVDNHGLDLEFVEDVSEWSYWGHRWLPRTLIMYFFHDLYLWI